ncbi:sigma-70 family RNA polymerase sigma factor [Ornithinibacillus californiensis]|uniref:sigma-70 family RNA polymerase sigma factor n=1 Tax=Ornithinibacillus californiensis TaxID=161536 RepID=UPI00064DD928|nr:sigma-70 family RNA polymerase sigma factor [Ornithinibacillus californiensis]
MEKKDFTFEEIFKQNEKRIHYHIHKLHIRDPYNEFYVEGLYAMWLAYKKYQPDKGPLATYFNFAIRNRLIDTIRSKSRDQKINEAYAQKESIDKQDGNYSTISHAPILSAKGIEIDDTEVWDEVKKILTPNQWKWVDYYIIQGLSQKEIADREGVSIDAVKSWAREARKKLQASDVLTSFDK